MGGIGLIIFLLFVFPTSFNWVRRNKFETFYYVHRVAVPLMVVCLIIHSALLPVFMAPALILYIYDLVIRHKRSTRECKVVEFSAIGQYTRIEVDVDGMEWEGGQYAFVKVAELSSYQWHPFSISSGPNDNHVQFTIKNMGNDSFTGQLHALAKSGSSITINVDGPYGKPSVDPHGGYSNLTFVAGGIGITPMVSMLKDLADNTPKDLKKVYFLWTVRTAEDAQLFSDALSKISSKNTSVFDIEIAFTRTKKDQEKGDIPDVKQSYSRPDITNYLQGIKTAMSNDGYGAVYACGPDAMIKSTAGAVKQVSDDAFKFHFHSETFLL
eukprot:TRINITY_DN3399_c0_g1_i2.p1 TRINITY_DN3399_c0_g1~~TRINITY_DN3399_c0_g1_i2.p1  ORF type:complete len:325 (+),score=107.74 TRINITY_DN3399_c0_g1_i2:748-1722(+)